jgi:hypothetical protein
MIFISGTQTYGKVDQVPGLFYVTTKFFHIQFIPLVPVGSYVYLDRGRKSESYAGFSIGLSGKSILFAWFRVALFLGVVAAVVAGAVAGMEYLEHRGSFKNFGVAVLALGMLVYLLYGSYRVSRAGAARARKIAAAAGLPPELIANYFGSGDGTQPLEDPHEPSLSES